MQTSAERGLGETPTRRHSDRDLIARFLAERDESAFAEIVSRYSRLVMSVALHTLRDPHAAEDAFQAAFLVLARNARRIRNRDSLASWLHGTTFRVSKRLLRTRLRRKEQELPPVELPSPIWANPERPDEQAALDEELARLSEGLRAPLVLHYLEGRTVPEIAAELKMSQSAIEGRLKRGKKTLRKRLLRRGVLLSSAAFGAGLTVPVEGGVAAGLVTATVAACLTTVASTSLTPIATSTIQQIALQETAAMARIALLKTALVCSGVAGAIGLAGAGIGTGVEATESLETASVHRGGRAGGAEAGDSRFESPASAIMPTPVIHTTLTQAPEVKPNVVIQTDGTRLAADQLEIDTRGQAATGEVPLPGNDPAIREELAKKNEAMQQLELLALQAQVQKQREATAAGNDAVPSSPAVKIISPPNAVTTPSIRAHIEEALKRTADMQFVGQTLEEILHLLAVEYKMPIIAEFGAIQQAGIPKDVEVHAGVKGIPLAEALQVVLGSVKNGGLMAEVEDDGLHIRPRPKRDPLTLQTPQASPDPAPAGLKPSDLPEFAMRGQTDASIKALQGQIEQLRTIVEAQKALIEKTTGTPKNEVELPPRANAQSSKLKPIDELLHLTDKVDPSTSGNSGKPSNNVSAAGGANVKSAPPSGEVREFRPESVNEDRMRRVLNDSVDFQFTGQTLQEVVNYLSSEKNIVIRLDTTELTNAGVSPDQEITLIVSGISLRSALNMLLKDVGGTALDYLFEDEVMVVTTKEKADETFQTVIYDASVLGDPTQVMQIIRQTVEPQSWSTPLAMPEIPGVDAAGGSAAPGQGTIIQFDDSIIVTTSRRLHDKTAEILKLLQQAKARKP